MRNLCLLFVLAACASPGDLRQVSLGGSQGIVLVRDAHVLFGTSMYCTRPATIDLIKVEAATPEGREIVAANVVPGSARHSMLRAAMHNRLVMVCSQIARRDGFDLVVRAGDIADARGLVVGDLTAIVERIVRRSR